MGATIAARTGGWPAALRLAGLALQTSAEPATAVAEFGGDQNLLAEYLREEVLDPLEPDAAAFLLEASWLDELSGPLCDAVLDVQGSELRLEQLDRDLLVTPVGGRDGWYRVHPLLRDLLQADHARQDSDGVATRSSGAPATGSPATAPPPPPSTTRSRRANIHRAVVLLYEAFPIDAAHGRLDPIEARSTG